MAVVSENVALVIVQLQGILKRDATGSNIISKLPLILIVKAWQDGPCQMTAPRELDVMTVFAERSRSLTARTLPVRRPAAASGPAA